jgi:hypothetical protein
MTKSEREKLESSYSIDAFGPNYFLHIYYIIYKKYCKNKIPSFCSLDTIRVNLLSISINIPINGANKNIIRGIIVRINHDSTNLNHLQFFSLMLIMLY